MAKDVENDIPAFPIGRDVTQDQFAPHIGMTLRDYFAARAIHALITEPLDDAQITSLACHWTSESKKTGIDRYAECAYKIADAMLKERTS